MKEPDKTPKIEREARKVCEELLEERFLKGKRIRRSWNSGTAKPSNKVQQGKHYEIQIRGEEDNVLNGTVVRVLAIRYRTREDGTKTKELVAMCHVLSTNNCSTFDVRDLQPQSNIIKITKKRKVKVKSQTTKSQQHKGATS